MIRILSGAKSLTSKQEKAPRLKYKPRSNRHKALDGSKQCLTEIRGLGKIMATQKEAATVFGVGFSTFNQYLRHEPEAMAAWREGKADGKMSLRRKLWEFAEDDPATARWLARDSRWLAMDEGNDRKAALADTTHTVVLTLDEQLKQVMALQAQVIEGGRLIEHKKSPSCEARAEVPAVTGREIEASYDSKDET